MYPKLSFIQKSAENGCVYAKYNLGSDYYFGIGTSKDVASARKYFHEAALNGHPGGMYMYGKCCLLGLGGDTNYQEAFYFTEMAASKSDINAIDGLGYLYESGLGCKKILTKLSIIIKWQQIWDAKPLLMHLKG